jgi:multidrug transporter EmrE-like cation transporter
MTAMGWWLVLLSAGLQVAGTLMLRAGVDQAGGFAVKLLEAPVGLLRLISQPVFDIGFIFYGLAALVWFRVLSTQPLSIAYPLLVSLTFLFVTLGAVTLFQETLSPIKVGGVVVIFIGIVMMSKG